MYQDNESDGVTANMFASQHEVQKKALASSDIEVLAASLSKLYYLSIQYPERLTDLLMTNGFLELLIAKTKMLSTKANSNMKAEMAYSFALSIISIAVMVGSSKLRCRVVQVHFS